MENQVEKLLRRIETRLIRGFNELNVDVLEDPGWLRVSGATIIINSANHSLSAIIKRAKEKGAAIGTTEYEVVYNGEVLCWL
jgi:hypothetical protein